MTTNKKFKDAYDGVVARYWAGSKNEVGSMRNGGFALKFFGEDTLLKNITAEKIEGYVKSLVDAGNSSATVNRKLASISKILRYAYNMEWIERVPNIIKNKESKNRIRYLSHGEETLLVETFAQMNRPELARLSLFLVDTGARVGEALRLEWKDIQDGNATFWDTKNGEARTIPLTKRLKQMLDERKASGDAKPFGMISQSTFNHAWNEARGIMSLATDKEFVPHALRHTCASRLVQAGIPILTVKEYLGHKSIQITMRYAHLCPAQLKQATQALE
jgi:hypothetical protein